MHITENVCSSQIVKGDILKYILSVCFSHSFYMFLKKIDSKVYANSKNVVQLEMRLQRHFLIYIHFSLMNLLYV